MGNAGSMKQWLRHAPGSPGMSRPSGPKDGKNVVKRWISLPSYQFEMEFWRDRLLVWILRWLCLKMGFQYDHFFLGIRIRWSQWIWGWQTHTVQFQNSDLIPRQNSLPCSTECSTAALPLHVQGQVDPMQAAWHRKHLRPWFRIGARSRERSKQNIQNMGSFSLKHNFPRNGESQRRQNILKKHMWLSG